MEAHQHCISNVIVHKFTNPQNSKHWTLNLHIIVAMIKPCAEACGLQKPRIRLITT